MQVKHIVIEDVAPSRYEYTKEFRDIPRGTVAIKLKHVPVCPLIVEGHSPNVELCFNGERVPSSDFTICEDVLTLPAFITDSAGGLMISYMKQQCWYEHNEREDGTRELALYGDDWKITAVDSNGKRVTIG